MPRDSPAKSRSHSKAASKKHHGILSEEGGDQPVADRPEPAQEAQSGGKDREGHGHHAGHGHHGGPRGHFPHEKSDRRSEGIVKRPPHRNKTPHSSRSRSHPDPPVSVHTPVSESPFEQQRAKKKKASEEAVENHTFSPKVIFVPSPPSSRIFPCNPPTHLWRIFGASPAYLVRISCVSHVTVCFVSVQRDA